MAYVICEKWFNSQLLEEILKILPQSLGQLSPERTLTMVSIFSIMVLAGYDKH